MTPKTIAGSSELGHAVRQRREELGLTIEGAARAAGVGSETWRRYEAGGSVRRDKVRGVCAALRWHRLPGPDTSLSPSESNESWEDFPKEQFDDSYSAWLEDAFGENCARTFASGCDILRGQIKDDLSGLAERPRGTHLGELDVSWLEGSLPPQWVPCYDYDFVFRLRTTVEQLRLRAVRPGFDGIPHFTRSVADDLALHLILEMGMVSADSADSSAADDWEEWEYELNGEDDEVITALFSETFYTDHDSSFHFDRWFDVVHYGLGSKDDEVDAASPGGEV
ncbi:helix-turn-helix domain-containing protein [Nocardia tengchongensis]